MKLVCCICKQVVGGNGTGDTVETLCRDCKAEMLDDDQHAEDARIHERFDAILWAVVLLILAMIAGWFGGIVLGGCSNG